MAMIHKEHDSTKPETNWLGVKMRFCEKFRVLGIMFPAIDVDLNRDVINKLQGIRSVGIYPSPI